MRDEPHLVAAAVLLALADEVRVKQQAPEGLSTVHHRIVIQHHQFHERAEYLGRPHLVECAGDGVLGVEPVDCELVLEVAGVVGRLILAVPGEQVWVVLVPPNRLVVFVVFGQTVQVCVGEHRLHEVHVVALHQRQAPSDFTVITEVRQSVHIAELQVDHVVLETLPLGLAEQLCVGRVAGSDC